MGYTKERMVVREIQRGLDRQQVLGDSPRVQRLRQ